VKVSKQQAIDAVNLLYTHCSELRDSVTIFRDEQGLPMVIAVQCPHCATLFDRFTRLDDARKERALQAAEWDETAGDSQPSNESTEERHKQEKETPK
jgi:hypothetical protein